MHLVSEAIENYCLNHSRPDSETCREILDYTRRQVPASQMLSGPLVAGTLGFIVGALGARRVVEVGCFTGYSALAMAEQMPADGKLITLDRNPETMELARRFWAKSPHGHKIEARLGDARELLKEVEGPVDFAFLDADKVGYLTYLQILEDKLAKGGMVAADNCLWSGKVLEADSREEETRALQRFNEYVRDSGKWSGLLLPVRDGLFLLRKNP